jgi:hypothetical protein
MEYRHGKDVYNTFKKYTVHLPCRGILSTTLEWTERHVECDWSWGHFEDHAYVSFEDEGEAMMWKLRWWDFHVKAAEEEPDELINYWDC